MKRICTLTLGGPEDGRSIEIEDTIRVIEMPALLSENVVSTKFMHCYVRCFDAFLYDGIRAVDTTSLLGLQFLK